MPTTRQTQPASGRCALCDGETVVTPHAGSAYEFDAQCRRVEHHQFQVSWAHAHPPPVFVPTTVEQSGLF